jgi:hypothetical protein
LHCLGDHPFTVPEVMVPCLIAAAEILRPRYGTLFETFEFLKKRLLEGFSSPIPTFPPVKRS